MELKKQKQPKFKPPRLLKGLSSLVIIFTGAILVSAWAIINYQVEKLVAHRTSEYARSITQIAANSAADALLSEDKIHLQMLVTNVAKDPYIRSATVFARDGQIVAEKQSEPSLQELSLEATTTTPKESASQEVDSSLTNPSQDIVSNPPKENTESTAKTENNKQSKDGSVEQQSALSEQAAAYIASQKDIPFVETILYQGVTAGWFKITLNRSLLEDSFRESLIRSQKIIGIIAMVLLLVLFFIVRKYKQRVKLLVNANHRLIKLNSNELPRNTGQWLDCVTEISETRFQELSEHNLPGEDEDLWHASRREEQTIFCYCQFSMADQENEQTASTLTLGEIYLQSALQAYGLQSQGDLLSGSLIPLFDYESKLEALNEAISLIKLVQKLLSELTLPIKMRAFVGVGSILVLENERGIVTGISLSNRMMDKLSKLAPHAEFENLYTLGLEEEELLHFTQVSPVNDTNFALNSPCFKVENIKESIIQRINRQISYILSQRSPSDLNNSAD